MPTASAGHDLSRPSAAPPLPSAPAVMWSVCETTWCVLAVIGVPSLRSASSMCRCGHAFVSGPCEEHRCRRHTTPPSRKQTRKWSVCETTWCVLAVIGVPSLRSASSMCRCGHAFVSGPCEEHRCRRHTTPPSRKQTTTRVACARPCRPAHPSEQRGSPVVSMPAGEPGRTPRRKGRMRYAEITGWGKALPPTVLSNADLEQLVDTSDDWITSRSGIKERRISHVAASDLAELAARRAIAAAGVEMEQIDLVINATCTPSRSFPPPLPTCRPSWERSTPAPWTSTPTVRGSSTRT